MSRPPNIPEHGDVAPKIAAAAIGLKLNDLDISLPVLLERGFPPPDQTTGNFSIDAIHRWRRARDAESIRPLTGDANIPHGESLKSESTPVGSVKIPYYVVGKYSRGYWRPKKNMKALGFQDIRCGPDGPIAWAIAAQWNARWQAVRRGEAPAPAEADKLKRDIAEATRVYPPGTVGAAFQILIRTEEWKSKPLSTRNKVWWPAWYRIRDKFGRRLPNSITFQEMSQWRAELERDHGLGVAHKTLKIWRALWTLMLGMRVATGADPTTGIRNKKPHGRHQIWTEGEVARLVKRALRARLPGLACIIAVAWDTMFAPTDVRTLRQKNCAVWREKRQIGPLDRLWFDRASEGRAKTGRPALGTLSRRTERLVRGYLDHRFGGCAPLPDTILFLNRSERPYRDDTLAKDFALIRAMEFPGDTRKLMDTRRSGTREAVAGSEGDGFAFKLSTKMANSIDKSNELHRTYSPANLSPVHDVDDARRRGRRKLRESEA